MSELTKMVLGSITILIGIIAVIIYIYTRSVKRDSEYNSFKKNNPEKYKKVSEPIPGGVIGKFFRYHFLVRKIAVYKQTENSDLKIGLIYPLHCLF